ncbi:MAG: VTC domain-containing protein [Candidatus Eisenbacteria bacterium]|uniref:VTC domain-containing protein n=1 Tax=Eiseniibacteriota bacterium TaxID=2212470 RepID=A0A849SMK9_UNCEI|nr:VTC domain-containing protein [Candidatus Eisenbacteria bacterium]
MPTLERWNGWLESFLAATPELLASRVLKRRTDSKFAMAPARAAELLFELSGDYALLSAGSARVASYRTLYFDTPRLEFFHAHRRGRRVRHKVRVRHYPDRLVSALEVKSRRTELETFKQWRGRAYGESELSEEDRAFVRLHTGSEQPVAPEVWTEFRRITLLGLRSHERVTLDFDLAIEGRHGRRELEDVVVVEVKQWPFCRSTPAMSALRAGGSRPRRLSKYCIAIAIAHPEVRLDVRLPDLRVARRGAA